MYAGWRLDREMTFQLAKVNKALGSVSQMVSSGHKVVFDMDNYGRDRSFIENKSNKERMWLRKEHGMYVLDMLVCRNQHRRRPEHCRCGREAPLRD